MGLPHLSSWCLTPWWKLPNSADMVSLFLLLPLPCPTPNKEKKPALWTPCLETWLVTASCCSHTVSEATFAPSTFTACTQVPCVGFWWKGPWGGHVGGHGRSSGHWNPKLWFFCLDYFMCTEHRMPKSRGRVRPGLPLLQWGLRLAGWAFSSSVHQSE